MRFQVYVYDNEFDRYHSRKFRTHFFARRFAKFYDALPSRFSVDIRPTFIKG